MYIHTYTLPRLNLAFQAMIEQNMYIVYIIRLPLLRDQSFYRLITGCRMGGVNCEVAKWGSTANKLVT